MRDLKRVLDADKVLVERVALHEIRTAFMVHACAHLVFKPAFVHLGQVRPITRREYKLTVVEVSIEPKKLIE